MLGRAGLFGLKELNYHPYELYGERLSIPW